MDCQDEAASCGMKARFSIEADSRHGLVRIKMAGFFTPRDIDRFLDARRVAHEALGCAPNAHVTLNDVRGMTAQPQSIVDAFQKVLDGPASRSRRLAFVVGPTLARAQLFRALAGRTARCFCDPVAAEGWLLSEDREAEPARRAAG
ncbi:MAG TPA: hypothetical protein VEX35_05475 [Allosphingosinicella sp.]|nr:hypothetical protein [Allosphingosinicella sp.]